MIEQGNINCAGERLCRHLPFENIAYGAPMKEFFSSILHDLHQPLVAIQLFAHSGREICGEEATSSDKLRRLFEGVGESVDLTIRTIGRLRSFVNGKPPSIEPTDVNQAIEEVVRLAEIVARSRGISIEEKLEPGLDCISADCGALQEAFLNLLFNAIEAIDHDGERRVSISTRSAGDAIEIEVADTGCGVPRELQDRLFETAFTTKPQGNGLGLGIVREIVRQHGGSISLRHSSPDAGTSFCVRLPVRLDELGNSAAVPSATDSGAARRRGSAQSNGPAVSRRSSGSRVECKKLKRAQRRLAQPA
jgi:signal transduction histidine kinase